MSKRSTHQMALFDTVSQVYADHGEKPVPQQTLYHEVSDKLNLSKSQITERGTVHNGKTFNVFHRDCRWAQQRLKLKGFLTRVDRGMWQLTEAGKERLTEIQDGYVCLAFSTALGVCLWGDARTIGREVIDDQINLILTSPPYLNIDRNYGTWSDEKAYVRFIVEALEPYIQKMAPGAGLVLNVGNDVFEKGQPTRSLYVERLVIELHDALGLHLVERIPWIINKCPGPTLWAFVRRIMLRSGFEFTFCFTNDPEAITWDNRNVLQEQCEEYLAWCRSGGQPKDWNNATYAKRKGAFSGTVEKQSKVPSNVLSLGHTCAEGRRIKQFAKKHNLPEHTATFPRAFAEFFIKWMTREQDLVVDPFGGTLTTASAAEHLNRRWQTGDRVLDFLQAGSSRFVNAALNPNLQWPQPV